MTVLIDCPKVAVLIRTALGSRNDVVNLSGNQRNGLGLAILALA